MHGSPVGMDLESVIEFTDACHCGERRIAAKSQGTHPAAFEHFVLPPKCKEIRCGTNVKVAVLAPQKLLLGVQLYTMQETHDHSDDF